MKTFNDYLNAFKPRFVVSMILAVVVVFVHLVALSNPAMSVGLFVGFSLTNLVIWFILAGSKMTQDRQAAAHRARWESSMLASIQLATAADGYFLDAANTMSAFHAAVQERHDEGVKHGYLDLGEL